MKSFDIEWKSLTRVLEEYADYFIQEAKDNLGKYGAYASGKLADTMKPFIEIGEEHFKIKIQKRGGGHTVGVVIAEYGNYLSFVARFFQHFHR